MRIELKPHANVFVSTDLNQGCDYLSSLFVPHKLRKTSTHPLNIRVEHMALGHCTIVRSSYGASIDIEPLDMQSVYQVKIPIAGKLRIHSGKFDIELEEGGGCFVSPTKALRYELVGNDSQFLTISIEAKYFAGRMASVFGSDEINDLHFDPMLPLDSADCQIWLELLQHIWDQHDTLLHAKPQVADIFKQDFCDLIVDRLLALCRCKISADSIGPRAPIPRIVRSAMTYIDQNYHKRIMLSEMAAWSGTSGRNLQLKFRSHLNMTPHEFIQKKRLTEAHHQLLAADPNRDTVTDIALSCGLTHLSRFAANYRVLFGCSPHDTLRSEGQKQIH